MWQWIAVIWVASWLTLLLFERSVVLATKSKLGLWDFARPLESGLIFGLVFVLAPALLVALLVATVLAVVQRTWSSIDLKLIDPLRGDNAKLFREDRTSFVATLVGRRKRFDRRLRKERLGEWPMWRYWEATEAKVLHIATLYYSLRSAGMSDAEIWKRFETRTFGSVHLDLSKPLNLRSYLSSWLKQKDPQYLALGAKFVARQIGLCEKYAHRLSSLKAAQSWPPREWLVNQIDWPDFNRPTVSGISSGKEVFNPTNATVDRRMHSELTDLQQQHVQGDEIWTFSSPPEFWQNLMGRGGVALVRNGHPVAHVITRMN